ncbi:MAG: TlpA family protein disulfide reductase [Planctomycetia bacterium]|jgi:thiol-disulfide isomerase/thioredoxin|nr:TlpA family protein disulfide reductase [Planctomycetia bacterium]OQY99905.1 MAG: hypothetical protein B6D36_15795 [Planctomycetes bacterium UTPLA1]
MTRFLMGACVVAVLAVTIPAQAGLKIGDKAPAVKAGKWMTSAPPALPNEKGGEKHVFLVEFWATWCPPCLKSIPHLGELHRKHGKDGLVIISVSNEEPETIEKFLKKNASNKKLEMPYHVASDDDMATNSTYMADIESIPHAFIVDRKGIVIWTGNPLDPAMDDAVEGVLAGTYNVEVAKKAAATTEKYEELMDTLKSAYTDGDKEKIFKTLDEMIALKPQELQPYLIRRQLMAEYEMQDQVAAWDQKIEAAMQDHPDSLVDLVEFELQKPIADRNAGLMYRSASRAVELTKRRDVDILTALAEVQCQLGMLDAAIATQREAVALADESSKESMKKVLGYLESAKALTK